MTTLSNQLGESVDTTLLVEYLHRARHAEHAVADLLATPPQTANGRYTRLMAAEARRAQQRIHDLDARVAAIAPDSAWSVTTSAVRRLAADALEVSVTTMTASVDVVRRPPVEPALVEHAHRLAAAIGVAHTSHHALAKIARVAGDSTTAELAAACLRELGSLQSSLDDAVVALVEAMTEATTRPTYREATTAVTGRVAQNARHLGQDARHAQRDLRATVTRMWRRRGTTDQARANRPLASARTPDASATLTATPTAITTATDATVAAEKLPINDYPRLNAVQIAEKLDALTPAELDTVQRYERAHANRVTVLNKIDALRTEHPNSQP